LYIQKKKACPHVMKVAILNEEKCYVVCQYGKIGMASARTKVENRRYHNGRSRDVNLRGDTIQISAYKKAEQNRRGEKGKGGEGTTHKK